MGRGVKELAAGRSSARFLSLAGSTSAAEGTMWKHRIWTLAIGLALAVASRLHADDNAAIKAVIDKAIQAVGGETKLAEIKGALWKSKLTYEGPVGKIEVTGDYTVQLPDRARVEVSDLANAKRLRRLLVVNGARGWERTGDLTHDMPKEMLEDSQEANYHTELTLIPLALRNSKLRLARLPEVKVGDRAAVGLKVSHPNHREVRLYYDKENGQLLKSETHERRWGKDGKAIKEVIVEAFYSDYRDVDGVRLPFKSRNLQDGKPYVDMEMTEVKWLKEKLEDRVFGRP
jgi:hypothetical protein